MTPNFQVATIDQLIWFHRPFKMDGRGAVSRDWKPNGGETLRGLVRGEIYNQKGDPVATAVQEAWCALLSSEEFISKLRKQARSGQKEARCHT